MMGSQETLNEARNDPEQHNMHKNIQNSVCLDEIRSRYNVQGVIASSTIAKVLLAREKRSSVMHNVALKEYNHRAEGSLEQAVTNELFHLKNFQRCQFTVNYINDVICKSARYIVMEYLPVSLANILACNEHPGLPEAAALQVLSNIASALSYMHARKVIHRDVKPKNILVNQDGIAKLADFRLSVGEDEMKSKFKTSCVLAPEMRCFYTLGQDPPYGTSVDIWALAIACIQMCRPYEGPEDPKYGVNDSGDVKRYIDELVYNEAYIELISRCLSQRVEERPKSAEIVKDKHLTFASQRLLKLHVQRAETKLPALGRWQPPSIEQRQQQRQREPERQADSAHDIDVEADDNAASHRHSPPPVSGNPSTREEYPEVSFASLPDSTTNRNRESTSSPTEPTAEAPSNSIAAVVLRPLTQRKGPTTGNGDVATTGEVSQQQQQRGTKRQREPFPATSSDQTEQQRPRASRKSARNDLKRTSMPPAYETSDESENEEAEDGFVYDEEKDRFVCSRCGAEIKKHLRSYHRTRVCGWFYDCEVCEKQLGYFAYKRHQLLNKRGKRCAINQNQCPICQGKVYTSAGALKKHIVGQHSDNLEVLDQLQFQGAPLSDDERPVVASTAGEGRLRPRRNHATHSGPSGDAD